MAFPFQYGGRGAGGVSANTTRYFNACSGFLGTAAITTEADAQTVYRTAMILSHLYLLVTDNTVTASSAFRLRVNSANVTQVITIPASTTGGFQDTTHTDAISSGNTVGYQMVAGATGTSIVFQLAGFQYDNVWSYRYGVQGQGTLSDAAFWALSDNGSATPTVETNVTTTWRAPGTIKNLFVWVNLNSLAAQRHLVVRVNGADSTLLVAIPSTTTGAFEDTTHSVTVTSGDTLDINAQLVGGAVDALKCATNSVEFQPSSNSFHYLVGAAGGRSATVTDYLGVGGGAFTATEANVAVPAQNNVTVSRLQSWVSSNSTSATSTVRVRKNSANGNGVVSIGSGATGLFEDTVHSDSLTPTDVMNYQTNPGSAAAIVINILTMLVDVTSVAGGNPWYAYAQMQAVR